MMRGYGYGYNMMGGYGWGGWLLMLLLGAVVIVAIVLLVLWAVRSSSGHGTPGSPPQTHGSLGHDEAVAIAKRRLATGEITPEQYDEIMRALGG